MKPIWLWLIFFVVYGLFSMQTHAQEGPSSRAAVACRG